MGRIGGNVWRWIEGAETPAPRRALYAALGAALALGALVAGCGDDEPTATSCTFDTECPDGSLCVDGVCAVVQCSGTGDCPIGTVCEAGACVTPADDPCPNPPCDPEPTCDTPPCEGDPCTDPSQCAAGQTCLDGACTPLPAACADDPSCGTGYECVDGSCVPCDGWVCDEPPAACDPPCEPGYICDEALGQCVVDPAAPGDPALCSGCTTAADCGEGWQCAPMANGLSCLGPCGTATDCPTGFACTNGVCAPETNTCAGCWATGCADGQACDPLGACVPAVEACGGCAFDWECGADQTCLAEGVCAPRCGGDYGACPTGSECDVDGATGVQACLYTSSTCCYSANPADCFGDPGACDPPCSGDTPVCLQGTCVACVNSSTCLESEVCDTATNECVPNSEECSGATPFFDDGQCVECLNNTHCSVGTCDPNSKKCVDDVCLTCVAPYPACAEVEGQWYCVQCASDDDCNGGTCNTLNFTCEGGFVEAPDACQSDADCDPGLTEYDLACDTDTGLCYDKGGGCDDVTSFCWQGGECLDFLEQFLGPGGGGLPPELTGGETLPGGACGCEVDGVVPFVSSQCPEGLLCFGFGEILALLSGGTNPGIGGSVCTALDLEGLFP